MPHAAENEERVDQLVTLTLVETEYLFCQFSIDFLGLSLLQLLVKLHILSVSKSAHHVFDKMINRVWESFCCRRLGFVLSAENFMKTQLQL